MNYTDEVGLCVTTCTPNFIKIGLAVKKLKQGHTLRTESHAPTLRKQAKIILLYKAKLE
jgi:hypothetical protein